MRRSVRDKALAEPYVAKLRASEAARLVRLVELIDQMTFFGDMLTESAAKVLGHFELPRTRKSSTLCSLRWMWRGHQNKDKVMPLELYLVLDTRSLGGSEAWISMRDRSKRLEELSPILGKKVAKLFSKDLDSFFSMATKAVSWVNTLPYGQLGILNNSSKRYGLDIWISAMGDRTEKLSFVAGKLIEDFLMLDEEINDLVFEFNAAQQPVRFHSILCRRECSPLDVLAPAEPRFRVVDYFSRRTGRRSSRDVQSYKQKLAQGRLTAALSRSLNRDATKEEIEAAISKQKKRTPSPWLTEELIAHCKLGRHTAELVRYQKKIAAVMDDWDVKRRTIQTLLQQR